MQRNIAEDPERKEDRLQREQVRQDTLINTLRNMTPNEAAQWVENNVTNLATAKTVLKILAKLAVFQIRQT